MKAVRRVLRLAAGVLAATVAYIAAAVLFSWLLTPTVVARALERAPFDPSEAPPALLRALVAVEDPSFADHIGVDPFTPGQGLTTITQATAKVLFLAEDALPGFGLAQGFFRAVWRATRGFDMGRDAMAVVLDRRCDKATQLRLFVNLVYMGELGGRQIVGLPEAARAYHGKELAELEEDEMLELVAMIEAPNGLHPVRRPRELAERVRRIRRLLEGQCRPRGLLDNELDGCA